MNAADIYYAIIGIVSLVPLCMMGFLAVRALRLNWLERKRRSAVYDAMADILNDLKRHRDRYFIVPAVDSVCDLCGSEPADAALVPSWHTDSESCDDIIYFCDRCLKKIFNGHSEAN